VIVLEFRIDARIGNARRSCDDPIGGQSILAAVNGGA
jgi:hypothetical protein